MAEPGILVLGGATPALDQALAEAGVEPASSVEVAVRSAAELRRERSRLAGRKFLAVALGPELARLETTVLVRAIEWAANGVEPGGPVIFDLPTAFDAEGAAPLRTPLAHVLFSRRDLERALRARGARPTATTGLCAASIVACGLAAGLELASAESTDGVEPAALEPFMDKLGPYSRRQLTTGRLRAVMRRPPGRRRLSRAAPGDSATGADDPARSRWRERQASAAWRRLAAAHAVVVPTRAVVEIGPAAGCAAEHVARERLAQLTIRVDADSADADADGGARIVPSVAEARSLLGDPGADLVIVSLLHRLMPDALDTLLEEAYGLLRPGGRALVGARCAPAWMLRGDGFGPPPRCPYTISSYLAAFHRAGFEVEQLRRRPATAALRARLLDAAPDVDDDEMTTVGLSAQLARPLEPEDVVALAREGRTSPRGQPPAPLDDESVARPIGLSPEGVPTAS